jgi:hypothetical protein
MQPARFLIGQHPDRGLLWASIDEQMHHVESAIGETRFSGYLKPFPREDAARAALRAAGAVNIEVEERPRGRGRRGAG